jgi:tRNA(adenine34) deaminase
MVLLMDSADVRFMRRCFDLARSAVERDDLPFGSVIARGTEEISAEGNGVRAAGDVTRHAEVCAIVAAQRKFGRPSLEGCTLYTNVEPCAFCSYAIRETRIARVVFGLASPLMGGTSRWDVLQDRGLSDAMPEVFAPAPEVVAGFLAEEADEVLRQTAPMMWAASRQRGLFVCEGAGRHSRPAWRPEGLFGAAKEGAMSLLRRRLFDRFSRGTA